MVSGLPTLTSVSVTELPAPAGFGNASRLVRATVNSRPAILGRFGRRAFMTLPYLSHNSDQLRRNSARIDARPSELSLPRYLCQADEGRYLARRCSMWVTPAALDQ